MIRNLTKAWRYLCFQRHRRTNLNACLNIPAARFSYWKDDLEKLIGFRKNGGFDYFPDEVFLGNQYNSYIHTARNAKVTSTRIVYEKTLMKRKVFRGVFRTHSNIYDEAFLRR